MDILQNLKNINWVDVLILILVLRGIYIGTKSGLTAEVYKFIGALLSLTVGVYWYSQAADVFIVNFNFTAWLSQFLCFVIITQGIRFVFKYGVVLILKVLNVQFVPQFERIGGGIVGFGRGILTTGILLLALVILPVEYISEGIYENSFSGRFLINASEKTYKAFTFWLPEEKTARDIFSTPDTQTKTK